jgi:drug/metabolite transporter (DMT)-like permease
VPGERLDRRKGVGLACAFAGIGIAFTDALRLPTRTELLGDLMELGGAVCWGATTVLIKARRGTPITPNKTLFYQLAGSAMLLLPLSLAIGEPGVVDATSSVVLSVLYQVIVVAFASYLAWFWLLTRYPASELSAFSFLTPLFGMLAGALVLGEPVGPALAAAMALVAAGIYLVSAPQRP